MTTSKQLMTRNDIQREEAELVSERQAKEQELATAIAEGDTQRASQVYDRLNEIDTRRGFLDRLKGGIGERVANDPRVKYAELYCA